MKMPKLLIPERDKTVEWFESVMTAIINNVSTSDNSIDIKCWKMFNNEFNTKDYDYLRKVGDNVLPAKPRYIPIQRHYCDLLISRQSQRPYLFSVGTVDNTSLKEKRDNDAKSFIEYIYSSMKTSSFELKSAMDMIDMQISQMQEQASKEPTTEEEQQQLQKIRTMLPILVSKLAFIKENYNGQKNDIDELVEKYDMRRKYTEKDWKEELGQKMTLKLRDKFSIKKLSLDNFKSHIVTGKQAYRVDYQDNKLICEIVPTTNIFYPSVSNIEYLQDLPWIVVRTPMSYSDIISRWGIAIEKKYGIDKLKEMEDQPFYYNNNTMVATPEGGVFTNLYAGTKSSDETHIVEEVYVRVPRKVNIKKIPNKHNGKHHTFFTTKIMIDENDYTYSRGIYTNKETGVQYKKDDVERYNSEKGETYYTKYDSDIYKGFCIDGKFFVDMGIKSEVYTDPDNWYDKKFPIVGKAFNGTNNAPYSIIWNTKDIQELYIIVSYHKELMLALAGAKGNVIDKSQKPSGMTDTEWEYKMALGKLYIETVDANGRIKNVSYNQWQSYDNTVTPSIIYLDRILEGLENIMSSITGIYRPSLGQTTNSDQVGTNKLSVRQTQLITEIIFSEHDDIERQALTQLVNLAIQHAYTEEDLILEIFGDDNVKDIVTIPKGLFKGRKLQVAVMNNTKDIEKLDDLKEIAKLEIGRGQMTFQQLISIFSSDTTRELEAKVEYFTKKQEEISKLNANSGIDAEKEIIKFTKEYDAQIAAMPLKYKEAELQIQQAELELRAQELEMNSQLKSKEIDTNAVLKDKDLEYRKQSEMALLQVNDKHTTVDEQLTKIQIELDALFKKVELAMQKEDSDKNVFLKSKEIEVKKEKKRNMEHIKN